MPRTHDKDGRFATRSKGANDTLIFGPFRLDCAKEILLEGDRALELPPKAFGLIAYLVRNAQRLVTKEELIEALWGNAHVGDAVIRTHLHQVRSALRDTRSPRQFVETVHGRGYRFVANVSKALQRNDAGLMSDGSRQLLVGRRSELEALDEAFARALLGKRTTVFVVGETGIGKSSIVNRFISGPGLRRTALVGHGRCIEQRAPGHAYLPFLEALARSCQQPEGQHVRASMMQHAPSWLALLPELATGRDRAQPRAHDFEPRVMLCEMLRFLPALTAKVPLVLLIDDLHWADDQTLELVEHISQGPDPAARLLLIGVHSAGDARASNPQHSEIELRLSRQRKCLVIEPGPLDEQDLAAYLNERFDRHDFSAEMARALQRRSAGNPLSFTALVDTLVGDGLLRFANGRWGLAGDLDTITRCTPKSIVALIDRQLDGLQRVERSILDAASVVGNEWWSSDVAEAADLDAYAVERLMLRWSKQRRFVRVQEARQARHGKPGLKCRFLSPLLRDVVHGLIAPSRLAELCCRLAGCDEPPDSWPAPDSLDASKHRGLCATEVQTAMCRGTSATSCCLSRSDRDDRRCAAAR